MEPNEFLIIDRYFRLDAPTDYSISILLYAYQIVYGKETEDLCDIITMLKEKKFDEVKLVLLSAYHSITSRGFLPNELERFLPKEIKHYEFDPSLIMGTPDICKITDFVNKTIAPDFDLIKGSFFKLAGMSAKDVKIIRANKLEDIVFALTNSKRFKSEALFMSTINLSVGLYFIEKLSNCSTQREIRVIVKDNKIQGISSYNMQGKNKYSENFIKNAIAFLEKDFLPLTNRWLKDFVVDVFEKKSGECQIIELNPYWTSFPCFYGEFKNIGTPFIIEGDTHYNAVEKLKELQKNMYSFLDDIQEA